MLNFGKKGNLNKNSDNGILGLKELEDLTEPILNPHKLKKFEWRRKLKSKSKNYQFKIKYYGELHENYNSLIVRTKFAPQKIFAIDYLTNEEILLFDGCKFGYNSMMCDEFSKHQIESRKAEIIYRDEKENEIFEIIVSAYYQIDFENELREQVDRNGKIELVNGEKVNFEVFKKNACDYFQILGINQSGQIIEILSEELA